MSRQTHLAAAGAVPGGFHVRALCGEQVDYQDVIGVEVPTCDECNRLDVADFAALEALKADLPDEWPYTPAPKQPYIEFDPCGPLPRRK